MKPVITARQVDELLKRGGDPRSLPSDAIYTPSALDLLRDAERQAAKTSAGSAAASSTIEAPVAQPATLSSRSPKAEVEALFASAYCQDVKQQICEVGSRLWQREYVDGNGGNIAVRVGEDLAICTPTRVSKGFMKPDDMCLVDFDGNQLAGTKGRTSEILMHLQIMARQPKAAATVHCHPPYATGFAIVGLEPPTCFLPEYELFASVALAPYRTPGTPEMGKLVADLVDHHNIVLMANHGVVAWSPVSVEDAYQKVEILEAYCRTVLVTAQLGKPPNTFTSKEVQDLLKIKQGLDIPDPRFVGEAPVLCDNAGWQPTAQAAPSPAATSQTIGSLTADELEYLIQQITDRILSKLQ